MAFGIAPARVLGIDWMLETMRALVIIVWMATVMDCKRDL